jgi:hypothetical protein
MRRAFPTITSNRAQHGVAGIRQAETASTTYSPNLLRRFAPDNRVSFKPRRMSALPRSGTGNKV